MGIEERVGWRSVLSRVPSTADDSNVIRHPSAQWAEIEREIIEATNEIAHWDAEASRVQTGHNTACDRLDAARKRFAEMAKTVGAKVEFVAYPQHLEREPEPPRSRPVS